MSVLATVATWVLPGATPAVIAPLKAGPKPAPQAEAPGGLRLHGVIPAADGSPAIALLKEPGRPVVLVPEGTQYNDGLRVERVLIDQVALRRRGEAQTYVLHLAGITQ